MSDDNLVSGRRMSVAGKKKVVDCLARLGLRRRAGRPLAAVSRSSGKGAVGFKALQYFQLCRTLFTSSDIFFLSLAFDATRLGKKDQLWLAVTAECENGLLRVAKMAF